MTRGRKRRLTPLFIALVGCLLLVLSCRPSAKPQTEEQPKAPANEPDTYAATIVRALEEGGRTEVTETRVMRAGERRREEWTEGGERRALIIDDGAGKRFLLNLDRETYSESGSEANPAPASPAAQNQNAGGNRPVGEGEGRGPEADSRTQVRDFVEDEFSEEPVKVETRALPEETVAGQPCQVFERRLSFAGGRTETTREFRATNLSGLAIKTEAESVSPSGRVSVTTEWRDIKLQVPADAFTVPPHFKKVTASRKP